MNSVLIITYNQYDFLMQIIHLLKIMFREHFFYGLTPENRERKNFLLLFFFYSVILVRGKKMFLFFNS